LWKKLSFTKDQSAATQSLKRSDLFKAKRPKA